MKATRALPILALATLASAANSQISLEATHSVRLQVAPLSFVIPKIGVRFGFGHWDEGMLGLGADVTLKVPFLPLPGLRLDAEAWSRMKDIGGKLRGNAISLLGMQTFTLAYAGIGPTYWFTSKNGDHESGLGVKGLVGVSLPKGFYAEASTILGPHPQQVFVWVGMRF